MTYDLEKEKREAIDAGNRALNSLREAQNNLSSAKNWGLWDLFGGGFISTMAKHSKMDRAKEHIEQARYDLQSFGRELNDLNITFHMNMDTTDFLSFADIFFDGFIVDWMMQDRIKQAQAEVDQAIQRVEDMLEQLYRY